MNVNATIRAISRLVARINYDGMRSKMKRRSVKAMFIEPLKMHARSCSSNVGED
jgi:hypothetical protein